MRLLGLCEELGPQGACDYLDWGQTLLWGHLVCLWDGDGSVLCIGQELLCAAGAG